MTVKRMRMFNGKLGSRFCVLCSRSSANECVCIRVISAEVKSGAFVAMLKHIREKEVYSCFSQSNDGRYLIWFVELSLLVQLSPTNFADIKYIDVFLERQHLTRSIDNIIGIRRWSGNCWNSSIHEYSLPSSYKRRRVCISRYPCHLFFGACFVVGINQPCL